MGTVPAPTTVQQGSVVVLKSFPNREYEVTEVAESVTVKEVGGIDSKSISLEFFNDEVVEVKS